MDCRAWATRAELSSAVFEWIEAFHNPRRRHFGIGYLSLVEYEALHTAATAAA
ncbi:IS3 family transposase [Kineococcus sp. NBC_00420]|uniref:IS3 family transposase n=1 Tax=Kineococcus sp. NBC_00420 TaxID=2903564 RepID=UPI003FA5A725